MKKTLLALAALTAFAGVASAQSSVTMSGIMKAGVASTKYSNGATGNGSGMSVSDGSSRIIIGANEDLGGGLFGIFQVDTRIRLDDNGGAPSSSPLASGNSFIGLRGGFGTFRLGKLDTHYCLGSDSHGVRATALQASSCGLLGYVNGVGAPIANTSRSVNIIRYDLPTLAGLTGGVAYSTSFASTEGAFGAEKGRAYSANLAYAAGPVSVAASMWNATNEPKTADQRAWTVTGGLNLGFMTVGLTFDRSSVKPSPGNRTERDVWSVPVTFKLGNGTLLGTYSKASKVDVDNAPAASNNTGATLWSVGYEYSLSKRTSLGIAYAALDNKSASNYGLYTQVALAAHQAPVAGQDQKQLSFGLRHTF